VPRKVAICGTEPSSAILASLPAQLTQCVRRDLRSGRTNSRPRPRYESVPTHRHTGGGRDRGAGSNSLPAMPVHGPRRTPAGSRSSSSRPTEVGWVVRSRGARAPQMCPDRAKSPRAGPVWSGSRPRRLLNRGRRSISSVRAVSHHQHVTRPPAAGDILGCRPIRNPRSKSTRRNVCSAAFSAPWPVRLPDHVHAAGDSDTPPMVCRLPRPTPRTRP